MMGFSFFDMSVGVFMVEGFWFGQHFLNTKSLLDQNELFWSVALFKITTFNITIFQSVPLLIINTSPVIYIQDKKLDFFDLADPLWSWLFKIKPIANFSSFSLRCLSALGSLLNFITFDQYPSLSNKINIEHKHSPSSLLSPELFLFISSVLKFLPRLVKPTPSSRSDATFLNPLLNKNKHTPFTHPPPPLKYSITPM